MAVMVRPTEGSTWSASHRKRMNLARQVYARDRNTPGYLCPGSPTRPCAQPIDWDLPYKDPDTGRVNTMSKSVDHAQERQDGGEVWDLDNCWTAHLGCNSSKGASRRWERTRPDDTVIHIDPLTV